MSMSYSERLAVAAHLHVLLRRRTGRVTDTEWMAANAEYAAEIVRFARARAQEDGAPELAEWAGRLEQAARPEGRPAPPPEPAQAPHEAAGPQAAPPDSARYVGRLR